MCINVSKQPSNLKYYKRGNSILPFKANDKLCDSRQTNQTKAIFETNCTPR